MENTRNIMRGTIAFFISVLFTSCSDQPKGDKAIITQQQEASGEAKGNLFLVDTAKSEIRFTGHGVGKNHPGLFKLSSGTVTILNNQITGGNFVIDINSMKMEQQGPMIEGKLKPHLLSGDFFDAKKFGTARFEITSVDPFVESGKDSSIVEGANYSVSGNFTLKDVTKNIRFPARIDLDGENLKAKGNFIIDRTQWKMNYGNDKTLGDKFISEKVNIELDLKAVKQ